jgi:hypothetical protein
LITSHTVGLENRSILSKQIRDQDNNLVI